MKYVTGKVVTTKMGPNDASGIVWAISECFLFYHVIFILTIIFKC